MLMLGLLPCTGATRTACLTDAEIDAAVGDQVRAGAPFVDTSELPQLPLCSGLTLGDQIQRIRAAAFPEEQQRIAEARAAVVAREEEAARAKAAAAFAALPPPAPPEPVPEEVEFDPAPPPAPRPAARKPRAKAARARPAQAHFSNCREARAAGAAPLRRGDPGYAPRLDRDGDGVACE